MVASLMAPSVQAQERSAIGKLDLEMPWSSLANQIAGFDAQLQGLNSRLDQMVLCGKIGKVYAPGAAGAAMVEAIVRDEKKLIACSVSLDGEYGQKDICLGVPVILGKGGWEQILDYKLNEAEQGLFSKSADAVRAMNDVLKTL